MLNFDLLDWEEAESEQAEAETMEELSAKDIAIIGISAKLPLVGSVEEFWTLVSKGADFISPFPESRRKDVEAYAKGRVSDGRPPDYFDGAYLDAIDQFDYAFFRLSPKEASLMNPNQRLFLETAWKAFEDAGYGRSRLAGSKTGVYVGYNADTLYDYKRMVSESEPDALSLAIPGNLSSIIAGRLSYLLDLKGPSLNVDTACSSSLVAVHLACQAIRNGECETALAGSVKVNLLPLSNEVKIGIEASDWRAHTFDDSSDGTGAGEGAIAFVLKPLHKAQQDGDHIHAVIKGSAVNQDGSSVGLTAPNVASQEEVIARAWQHAGIDPETIGYIEAHGTGTKLGDPIEIDGLTRAFRRFTDRKQFVAVGSVKANIGHLDHAAGMAGLLKAVLAMKHRQIPPLAHFARPNRAIHFIESPVYVADRLMDWERGDAPRRCGVSAFGMSGTNAHVVLEEAPEAMERESDERWEAGDSTANLLALSAKSESALQRLVLQYSECMPELGQSRLADLCYSANTGRDHYEHRLAFVFESAEELAGQLASIVDQGLIGEPSRGIYYGEITGGESGGTAALAASYAAGADIDWGRQYAGRRHARLPLPTYPFEPSRCWLEAPASLASANDASNRGAMAAAAAVGTSHAVTLTGKPDGSYTKAELGIAQAWGETLGLRSVDLRDNYYEAGGDSILALKIVNRASSLLAIRVEVADLLKHATISELAAYVEGLVELEPEAAQSGYRREPLAKAAERLHYPLTPSQYRVYIQEQFASIGTGNNTPFGIMAHGELDASRLEAVFRQLLQRHASLRASFVFEDGQVIQRIAAETEFHVQQYRCSEEGVQSVLDDFIRPFDLAAPPMLRVGLVRLVSQSGDQGEQDNQSSRHLILIDLHHIASDGVSTSILIKEFCELYKGGTLAELPLQYVDFVVWQQDTLDRGGFMREQQYWRSRLSGSLPLLSMPADFERGGQKSLQGRSLKTQLPAELKRKLEKLAQRSGWTMNSLLFAVYGWMLRQFSNQEDLVVGTLVAGRNHPELEQVIGMFINFLPVRLNVPAEQAFADFANEVHRNVLEAYAHDYPFDWMVSDLQATADRSRNPLYDTMFVYHNEFAMNPTDQLRMEEAGLRFEEYPLEHAAAPLDFKLDVWNGVSDSDSLTLVMQYDTALFKEETVRQWLETFVAMAGAVAEQPSVSLMGLPRMDSAQDAAVNDGLGAASTAELTVAVSATFTAEPIAEPIAWWCQQFQRDVTVAFAPYHQVFQQLLDPSSMISTNDGINVLLARFEDWIREDDSPAAVLKAKLDRIYGELEQAMRNRSARGTYVVGTFPVTPGLPYSAEVIAHLEQLNEQWRATLAAMDNVRMAAFDESLAALYQVPVIYDPVMDHEGHMPFTEAYYAAIGTTVARTVIGLHAASPFKVIALDCDNTLWKGICGEDGPLGVSVEGPYAALQQFMLDRLSDGMLLVLSSKNNEADVWEVFDRNPGMLLKREHFVAAQLNWEPKADNLRLLAEQLNLGLDSFIFVDDNPKEISEMMAGCPSVLSLQVPEDAALIPHYLQHVWAFDKLTVTEEDRRRSDYYRAESQRRSAQQAAQPEARAASDESGSAAPAAMDAFLAGLNLRMKMRLIGPDQIARASQLTQRTNQFNLSTIRRTEDELRRLAADSAIACWGIEVADRFGDYGFVGLVIGAVEDDLLALDTFLLSCRVLGRRVEHAILCELKRFAAGQGAVALAANYVATDKNEPFRLFLQEAGWTVSGETADGANAADGAGQGSGQRSSPSSRQSPERYVLPLTSIPDEAEFVAQWEDEAESFASEQQVAAGLSSNADERNRDEAAKQPLALALATAELRHWEVPGADAAELKHRHQLLPLQHHRGDQLLALHKPKPTTAAASHAGPFDQPVGATETALAAIVEDILGRRPIGALDHFFAIGGNSLQAVSLASRIHQQFSVTVSLRDLFAAPTVRELSRRIDGADRMRHQAIEPAAGSGAYPVTSAQKRLLVLEQMDVPSLAYNQPILFVVEGDLDVGKFRAACQALVRRHAILSTAYRWVEEEGFVGSIADGSKAEPTIDYIELGEGDLEEAIASFIRPFDLKQSPLFRAGAIRMEASKHLLLFDMHHIAADGVSISLLMKEFMQLYSGEALPELRVQYRDFAFWQSELLQQHKLDHLADYWLNVFADGVPVLNLPLDAPRPSVRGFAGRRYAFELPTELQAGVKRLASEAGATPFMIYLAVFQMLLAKYAGQEDVVVGTPVAGREHSDLQTMVGMFVQTLALRSQPEGKKPFRQFLREVKDNAMSAMEHQAYPFEMLVERLNVPRDLSRNPLFDTMFVYQNMDWATQQVEGLQFRPYKYDTKQSRFDLTLELSESGEGLRAHMEYATELFEPGTIAQLSRHFVQLLKAAVQAPDRAIGQVEMLDAKERSQIMFGFNATYAAYEAGDQTIHGMFEQRAKQTPEQEAVFYEGRWMTYRELNTRANQLARTLRNEGVAPDQLIGIMTERSFEMVIGILAIMKAGGAYVPIDPAHPADRIASILQESGAKLLLLQGRLLERLPGGGFAAGKAIDLDDPQAYETDGRNLEPISSPANLAYVIFTSGSTGKPKGVMVEQRSIVHMLSQLERLYPLQADDRYLLKTTYAFDVSVAELFGWFVGNGQLIILPQGDEKDPDALVQAISRHGITHINFVPSMLQALLNSVTVDQLAHLQSLTYIFAAGEALTRRLVEQYERTALPAQLENLYGPTEATIYATRYTTGANEPSRANVPIGRPLPNVQAWIVNGELQLQPIGVPGELCISGEGLARGYWDRLDLTADKFVANPHVPGGLMYRTGDWVRWQPDGNIAYLGRIDHQVKIRGYRIEIGEVEAHLRKVPRIQEAVVTARADEAGQFYLCGYFVAAGPITVTAIREALAQELPGYMIPARFQQLEALPLNANGKIDLKALPAPELQAQDMAGEPPANPLEAELAVIWSELLGASPIGMTESFFEIGGHSLHAIGLRSRILQAYGVNMPLADLFRLSTIRQQAEAIAQASPQAEPELAITPAEAQLCYPLSSGQLRLYVIQQLALDSTAYNLPGLFRLEGALDRERAEQALRALIARHESLRTSFAVEDGQFMQFIQQEAPFQFGYREAAEEGLEALAASLIQPFDLGQAPLLRATLIKLTEADAYALFFDMHHIVSDGVSMAVLIRDFIQLYNGEELPELRIQFKDYAVWQQRQVENGTMGRHAEYWQRTLSGPLPVLALPTDFPRPSVQSFEGGRVSLLLEPELQDQLQAVAASNGATLYMALLAAYALLLQRYSNQDDLIIGTPSAGRADPDLQPLIGMFVQMLVIRCRPAGDQPYEQFLQAVKADTIAAFEHQDYPLEELTAQLNLPRDVSRNPLFDAAFVMHNQETAELHAEGLRAELLSFRPRTAKFDLTLEASASEDGFMLALDYASKLFRPETMAVLLDDYVRILRAIAADPTAEARHVELQGARPRPKRTVFEDVEFNF
ncbi:amino acid adenylation domain protein [Paenibacillus curdlanolyticus YK9]|uniref:Amino acid adenylation domain protein n=1 Tax=Paenibacillus curdlanolyticus YK9 TaxID=717606 RepID=E0I7S5_9BACL|nr:non-ribosomal peptide synthetase [Paenibacillus curdlanolyticus]EFM11230.1 amino acid adenylation domain protein [Paenibacillus curdlanolyticus YK9]